MDYVWKRVAVWKDNREVRSFTIYKVGNGETFGDLFDRATNAEFHVSP